MKKFFRNMVIATGMVTAMIAFLLAILVTCSLGAMLFGKVGVAVALFLSAVLLLTVASMADGFLSRISDWADQ
mgnify:CR=1 FL=1